MTGGLNQSGTWYSFAVPAVGGYDANGNLLTASDSVMGQWNYGYDNLNRLTTGTAPGVQPTGVSNYFAGVASGWTYDAWGNRRSQTQGAVSGFTPQASLPASSTATFNTSNQLTTVGYAMDAAGEVQADGLNHYLYDAEGRICAVQNSVGGLTGYVYDAAGTRVAAGNLTSFSCNFASNGYSTTKSWVLGPGGEQVTHPSPISTLATNRAPAPTPLTPPTPLAPLPLSSPQNPPIPPQPQPNKPHLHPQKTAPPLHAITSQKRTMEAGKEIRWVTPGKRSESKNRHFSRFPRLPALKNAQNAHKNTSKCTM